MKAYKYLLKRYTPRKAENHAVLWYAVLIMLAFCFNGTFENIFRYANF